MESKKNQSAQKELKTEQDRKDQPGVFPSIAECGWTVPVGLWLGRQLAQRKRFFRVPEFCSSYILLWGPLKNVLQEAKMSCTRFGIPSLQYPQKLLRTGERPYNNNGARANRVGQRFE